VAYIQRYAEGAANVSYQKLHYLR